MALGYINTLISAGQVEDAARQAREFAQLHPHDKNLERLHARIAEAQGDIPGAIQQWREVLRRSPDDPLALSRLGAALVHEGRFEEAQTCAEQLLRERPHDPAGHILLAQTIQRQHGPSKAQPIWKRGEAQFGGNANFLRSYGRALLDSRAFDECLEVADRLRRLDPYQGLLMRGEVLEKQMPYQNHTAFWSTASSALPANTNLTRRHLDSALRARGQRQAEAAFDRLVHQRQTRVSDADYAVGLGLAYLQSDDKAAACATVRRFMKSLRGQPDYRAAALRLDRVILAAFPRSNPATAVSLSGKEARFTRIVSSARLPDEAVDAIMHGSATESSLRQGSAMPLLDTDINRNCCQDLVRLVRDHLASKKPFSLIRLGDGEANAVGYPPMLEEYFDSDAAERERVWWGRTLSCEARVQLAARVRRAIERADALGVPTRGRLLRDVRLDGGPPLARGKSGRGLLALLAMLETVAEDGSLKGKFVTSAHVHQDLERWSLYGELFDDVGDAILVSCHAGLPDELLRRFGLRIAKHVLMPPGDSMLEMQQRALMDSELPPLSLDRALEELDGWPEGRLVLVGAGYAGKVVVDEARRRGGVALDLGSIFDHWSALHTRSYQDIA